MNQPFRAFAAAHPLLRQLGTGWNGLLRATSLLALGDTGAKVLALGFFILLARATSLETYGIIRYAITIANFGAIVTAALSITLGQSIASRELENKAQRVSAGVVLSLAATVLGLATVLLLALEGQAVLVGAGAVVAGLCLSYTYLASIRALGEYGRAALFPVLSNTTQLVCVVAAALWVPQYILVVALTSYGLTYFLSVFVLESVRRSKLQWSLEWSAPAAWQVARFTLPLLVSQACYTLLFGIDLVMLQGLTNAVEVGLYAAAKSLAVIFLIVPNALYGVLMPKTAAEGASVQAKRNLRLGLVLATLSSGALVLVLAVWGGTILGLLFGADYARAHGALVVLGVGMFWYALAVVLAAYATGRGLPNVQGIGMAVGLAVAVATGPFLITNYGMVGASAAFAAGTFALFAVILLWSIKRASNHWNSRQLRS